MKNLFMLVVFVVLLLFWFMVYVGILLMMMLDWVMLFRRVWNGMFRVIGFLFLMFGWLLLYLMWGRVKMYLLFVLFGSLKMIEDLVLLMNLFSSREFLKYVVMVFDMFDWLMDGRIDFLEFIMKCVFRLFFRFSWILVMMVIGVLFLFRVLVNEFSGEVVVGVV